MSEKSNWIHIVDVEYEDNGNLRLYLNTNGVFSRKSGSNDLMQDSCNPTNNRGRIMSAEDLAHFFKYRKIKNYEIIQ